MTFDFISDVSCSNKKKHAPQVNISVMENATMSSPSVESQTTKIQCYHLKEEWSHTKETFITNVILIIVNLLTSVTSTVGNILVVMAVKRTRSLRTPSNALLCSLALSDLLVGAIVQPMYALQMIFEIRRNSDGFCIAKITTTGSLAWVCAGVSFLVISAISVERLLAIKLHLRYKALVTIPRVLTVVMFFWVLCTALIMARILGAPYSILVLTILVMDVNSIAIVIFAYSSIYHQVRKLQNKTRDQRHLAPPGINIHSFKRSAVTMLYVIVLFLACYIPFITTLVVRLLEGGSLWLNIIYKITASIVYINSSLNPFVYCFRSKEVRTAIFKLLGRKYTLDKNGDVIPVSKSGTQNLKTYAVKNLTIFPSGYFQHSLNQLSNLPETQV